MKARKATIALLFALGALLALAPQALAGPVWKLSLSSQPTNFKPGATNAGEFTQYTLLATNVGGEETSGPITFTDTLPEGVTPVGAAGADAAQSTISCGIAEEKTVTCTDTATLQPGQWAFFSVKVDVDSLPEGTVLSNEAEVKGGGTPSASASSATTISSALPSFGFLPGAEGLSASFSEEDGLAAVQAGSHPYQFTVDVGFPNIPAHSDEISYLPAEGGLRDVRTFLPRGLVVDPAATPVRCNEAQLESESCPDESVLGDIHLLTTPSGVGFGDFQGALYNMVPPAGAPAALGLNAAGVGIFVHLVAGVRSDGNYEGFAVSSDVLARFANPIYGARLELWGDPSSPRHDFVRSDPCIYSTSADKCEVDPQNNPLLTLPGSCSEAPRMEAEADAWANPGVFRQASAQLSELSGAAVQTEGCGGLEFEPSIEVRPTTTLADSPTGLDVKVHQPQRFDLESPATAIAKDTTITFPAGLAVNASSGDGLGACSLAQIGYAPSKGQIHFSKGPAGCPDASKLGTVEVTTPLLAQYDGEDKVQRDAGGKAIPEPLHGSIYLAKPFENPFGSLLAVYITVEDPQAGIFAKLAGKVTPDPLTGQLSTRVEGIPQLPVEDFKVHLFEGARAGLQSPPTCATYTTTSDFTPWSAPEGLDAHPTDSFQTTTAASGGPCAASEAQLPNSPTFTAGTVSPQAGKYSTLLFKLSREDGSQRLTKLEATLPPGLTGKLAGVAQCSGAQIAAARARNHPNEGIFEGASPRCPAASEVGTVIAGAGAGPTPLYVQGHVYMAGPYEGAPLSMVFITPALAGPFDLGVVVVRAAIYFDPLTAQPRAVSDPFPTILEGIPLNLRSVAVRLDRPNFTLNPTSCAQKSFTAVATSALGQIAPLSERFQVGGCKALPYKPKLSTRLFGPIHRGGHPRFRAIFTAKPGEANTKRLVLALPSSEFIDQGHFRTICTRVQFAAKQCPAGSVYGHVKAITPLLDYPLEGPVYLRSSSHELPDAVAALKGPPSQPIEVEGVARIDSVNGGLRITAPVIPDAPIAKLIITQQGGRKGLFQNSTNICKGTHRATVTLDGQNGKAHDTRPLMKADCPNASKKKKSGGKHR